MAEKHQYNQKMKASKGVEADFQISLSPANVYLLGYNIFQFFGWSILLFQTAHYLLTNGFYLDNLWSETSICLKLFQTLAVLEIFHVVMGMVKSNVVSTATQVFSRVFLVWGICNAVEAARQTYGLPLILIAWSVTEVIRYSFYFLNIIKSAPSFLVYLRYTLFIGLYPMGVIGEQFCILAALPILRQTKMFTVSLPNSLNFTFDYYIFCIVMMVLYIPFFPQLYLHMFSQRRKLFGKPELEKKKD